MEKAEELGADFVEVRLDSLETSADLNRLASNRKVPLIATDKSKRPETERRQILLTAARSGFNFVDVDLSNPDTKSLAIEIKASGAQCIVSFHDSASWSNVAALREIQRKELAVGADVCKIITTPDRFEDNIPLLQFVAEASPQEKVVCFGMGQKGWPSRFLSPLFGSFFTFASLENGKETAPGQVAVSDLKHAYKIFGLE